MTRKEQAAGERRYRKAAFKVFRSGMPWRHRLIAHTLNSYRCFNQEIPALERLASECGFGLRTLKKHLRAMGERV